MCFGEKSARARKKEMRKRAQFVKIRRKTQGETYEEGTNLVRKREREEYSIVQFQFVRRLVSLAKLYLSFLKVIISSVSLLQL